MSNKYENFSDENMKQFAEWYQTTDAADCETVGEALDYWINNVMNK